MQLNAAASTVLVISYLVASVVLIVLLGALIYLLARTNQLLNQIASRVDPTLEKADEVLAVVADRVSVIGERTEGLLTQGEAVVETVHDRVDRTTSAVQRTINAPLIGVNSLAAGLSRGLHTFSRLQEQQRRRTGIAPTALTTAVPERTTAAYEAYEENAPQAAPENAVVPPETTSVRLAVPAGTAAE